jgi:PEP-CTERM motif
MYRKRYFVRANWIGAALFSMLFVSGIARGDIIVGTSSGIFVNPDPTGGSIVVTGVGTSTFTWGAGDPPPPNSMSFVGSSFSTTTETPFKIGTLTYFNGTTDLGSTPNSVNLSVGLHFTAPPAGTQSSAFTLGLVSTTNTSDPIASADYVYFPSGFSSTIFSINGTNYTLMLTGFENVHGSAGFLGSNNNTEFHVEEGGTASADLYGEVTANLTGVIGAPEPSTFVIGVLGAGGMIGFGIRRRRNARTT